MHRAFRTYNITKLHFLHVKTHYDLQFFNKNFSNFTHHKQTWKQATTFSTYKMQKAMTTIQIKRVYDDASGQADDGFRVLVDRLWPRGESKEKFHYDLWAKQIAPSSKLRQWYHADMENRWDEFKTKYTQELSCNPATTELIKTLTRYKNVTLLHSSRNLRQNNAVILAAYLASHPEFNFNNKCDNLQN